MCSYGSFSTRHFKSTIVSAYIMSRTIAIIGATGNQGGSVAAHYLSLNAQATSTGSTPPYHIRGLTRNPTSPAAQDLVSKGVEIVRADLDDLTTLTPALAGANLIFSITNYWEPFFRPDSRARAAEQGISPRRYAYDVEYQQGKNIADAAAATVSSLDPNGFIASTTSHAGKCSDGKFKELYHLDAKADVFPDYVNEKHPELAKKMSCLQTGTFMHSYLIAPASYLRRLKDGSFETCFTTHPDTVVPHLDPVADVGAMVHAVSQLPAGKSYMAAGSLSTWTEWMEIWGRLTGSKARYRQVSEDDMVAHSGEEALGKELADMFSYFSWPGLDGESEKGVERTILYPDDIRKLGVDVSMTTLEDYIKATDWSAVLAKEPVE